MTKVLVATEKPFAAVAVDKIKNIFKNAGFEVVMLEKYTDNADLIKAVADVDAMIIRSDIASKEVIEAGKKLKIVVRAGAGYDNIDLEAATKNKVVAMNTPGQNSNAVAELAFGMMVYMCRNKLNGSSGTELRGKNLGIHAYGYVGKLVAQIGKGFGMNIFAFDPYVDKKVIESDGVTCVSGVKELYSKCQYVSVHIPANAETTKSINHDLMSSMPKGATIINTARKEVIDENSLLKIFEERGDFKYATDIEPGNKAILESKFADRYFATPKKMGAQTSEANINAGIAAANQIVNFITKGDKTFQVN